MITELHQHWDVDTPQGPGRAVLVDDAHQDYVWTVILNTGELVTLPQSKMRIRRHYTYGINFTEAEMASILRSVRNGQEVQQQDRA